jgi:hypothetical protein
MAGEITLRNFQLVVLKKNPCSKRANIKNYPLPRK